MTPEEKNLLERTYKLAEENNGILKSIRRGNRFSIFMRLLYWVVIIGASVGAYYFIQPYINQVLGMYSEAQSNIETMKSVLGQ
jgi:hypothetical protein